MYDFQPRLNMQRILNKAHAKIAASKPYYKKSRPTNISQPVLQESNEQQVVVYSDGSSRGNGQSNAVAGCGVYFGPDDSRNIACRVPASLPQTNQVSELLAMTLAVETLKEAKEKKSIVLYSDSSYCIQGITSWINGWKKNNWMSSQKKPVMHESLWKRLDKAREGLDIQFIHVRGHCGIAGNEAADRLAVQGASMKEEPATGGKL